MASNEMSNAAPSYDRNLVQINATSAEVYRRIEAFTRRKRAAIDERNRRLYCGRFDGADESDDGDDECDANDGGDKAAGGSDNRRGCHCARVDAVHLVRAPGSTKSRLKVSRVTNKDGPQTAASTAAAPSDAGFVTSPTHSRLAAASTDLDYGIAERLGNLEAHLGLDRSPTAHGSGPDDAGRRSLRVQDLLARIKRAEDRILLVEGLSPEYFSHTSAVAATAVSGATSFGRTHESGEKRHLAPSVYHRSTHSRSAADRALPVASAWPGSDSTAEDVTGDTLSLPAIEQRMQVLRERLRAARPSVIAAASEKSDCSD